MEKIVMTFETPKNKEVLINGTKVEVKPYLSISEQIEIADDYVSAYFYSDEEHKYISSTEWNSFGAEYILKIAILDKLTNIDVDQFDLDGFNFTDIFDNIISHVFNYCSFRESLYEIVESIKEQKRLEKSLGKTIDSLAMKAEEFFINMKNVDVDSLSRESIALLNEIKESGVGRILSEAQIEKDKNKQKTKRKTKKIE